MKIKWRKWNNIIHRDLGYLMVGLSIIYAISGFMLNHKHDWNPHYSIDKQTFQFQTLPKDAEINKVAIDHILTELNLEKNYTSMFRPDPQRLQLFYTDKTVTLIPEQGSAEIERISNRKVIHEMNILHLNTAGSLWTWIADFYALALFLLAITGLFVLKGKKGIKGRGAWLTALGIIIPIIFMIIL